MTNTAAAVNYRDTAHVRAKMQVVRPVRQTPEAYSNVREFSPEKIREQFTKMVNELNRHIVKRAVLSVNVDESGVNMTIIDADFQISLIYHEGGSK